MLYAILGALIVVSFFVGVGCGWDFGKKERPLVVSGPTCQCGHAKAYHSTFSSGCEQYTDRAKIRTCACKQYVELDQPMVEYEEIKARLKKSGKLFK